MTPNEWVQFWKFVADSNLFKCTTPSEWMEKIIVLVPTVDCLSIRLFEHLLTCAKVTDTRMVKYREEYERCMLWEKRIRQKRNYAVADAMKVGLEKWTEELDANDEDEQNIAASFAHDLFSRPV